MITDWVYGKDYGKHSRELPIVTGARDLAAPAYDDVIDRIHAESLSKQRYKGENEYAEVVSFNTALAAESMLEDEGELTMPP